MTKESFNNYMAYYDLYYTANGNSMPTGSKLTEFKKDLLDSLVQVGAMTAQAKRTILQLMRQLLKVRLKQRWTV